MMNNFIIHPDNSILLISRDADNLSKLLALFNKAPGDYKNDTLFIFDEVHGAGSDSFVENLKGCISPYKYRLGLSATPEREYDDDGNQFLRDEIGDIIFVKETEKDGYLLRQTPEVSGGAVMMDVHTGRILGMVGGYIDSETTFNRATQANRQLGSIMKPFVYLSAFESECFLNNFVFSVIRPDCLRQSESHIFDSCRN